jgi:hypothetical protein
MLPSEVFMSSQIVPNLRRKFNRLPVDFLQPQQDFRTFGVLVETFVLKPLV